MKILILVEGSTEQYLIDKITDYLNQKTPKKKFINIVSNTDHILEEYNIIYKTIDIHGVSNLIEKTINAIKGEYQANNKYDYYFLLADLVDIAKDRKDHYNKGDSFLEVAEKLQLQIKTEIRNQIQSLQYFNSLEVVREDNFFIHLQPWMFENIIVAQLSLYFKIYKRALKQRLMIEKSLNISTPEQNKKTLLEENITAKRNGYIKPPKKFITQCDIDEICSKCHHFKHNLLQNMFERVLGQ